MWFSACSFLLTSLLATSRPSGKTTMNQKVLQFVQEQPSAMIWVDVENVRGFSGFTLSHQEILDHTTLWIKQADGGGLYGKVVMVVDHGSVCSGYWLKERGFAVVFAGPGQKADDVLAREAGRSLTRTNLPPPLKQLLVGSKQQATGTTTIVVTADSELQRRCRRGASSKNNLYIMHPDRFLGYLERAQEAFERQQLREHKYQKRQEENTERPSMGQEKEGPSSDEIAHGTGDSNSGSETIQASVSQSDDLAISIEEDIRLGKLDAEIRLGGQLLDAEAVLASKNKKTMTTKRRKKLEKRIQILRDKLAQRGPSVLDRVTAILRTGSFLVGDKEASGVQMTEDEQDVVLSRWAQLKSVSPNFARSVSPRRETTGERVLLAERLRRSLVDSGEGLKYVPYDKDENGRTKTSSYSPAIDHVNHLNGYLAPALSNASLSRNRSRRGRTAKTGAAIDLRRAEYSTGTNATPDASLKTTAAALEEDNIKYESLKIVVISDTHGFEHHFCNQEDERENTDQVNGRDSSILPDGDILLHLGDFTIDNGTYEDCCNALERFDKWLAKQPHKYKIILRGNHDPWSVNFVESSAAYITRPKSVLIGDFVLAMVPYASSRTLAASGGLPSKCDILASHVPPKRDLDKCYTGRHAGSGFLTGVVHGMVGGGQPRVWFCGHIHEGRGVKEKRFGKTGRTTTVINAANANSGRASHLVHGPVVVELDSSDDGLNILQMDDKSILHSRMRSSENFGLNEPSQDEVNEMLLAVDLGLQSGLSLFNSRGELIRYEQKQFENVKELRESARDIIEQWEDEVNGGAISTFSDEDIMNMKPWMITHVAIEGNDLEMQNVWAHATGLIDCDDSDDFVEQSRNLLLVRPDEWRVTLLSKKERESAKLSKAAARLIARQVVADYGNMNLHNGKFKTDVAESVVMGLHVARTLGWVTREPAIRRYSNGGVIVPKAFA